MSTPEATCPVPPKLADLAGYLASLDGRADLGELARLLEAVDITRHDIAPACVFGSRGYRRNTIASGRWFELLALCWRSGDCTPIHDHEGSSCAFKVIEGLSLIHISYEAAMAVAYGRDLGFDEADAMASITCDAAEILGIGEDYGTIEVGKSATLLLTDGTPLEMTTTIEAAFIDGAPVDLGNKQTVLRDRYREKYRRQGIINGDDN